MMELLAGLILLVIIGGVTIGGGVMLMALFVKSPETKGDAPRLLDELFDTDADTVRWGKLSKMRDVTVIEGGIQRGWELAHEGKYDLLFRRVRVSNDAD